MSIAALTTVLMDIAAGRIGTLERIILSGKDVKGWEEVAQLGCYWT